jgi:hypothetical protein
LLVATPAIVGSDAPLVPDPEVDVDPGIGEGATGDSESLQPATVTDRTTADRKPMLFFMTLSPVSFAPQVLGYAASRCIRLRMFCRRRLCGHFLRIY